MTKIIVLFFLLAILGAVYYYHTYILDNDDNSDDIAYLNNQQIRYYENKKQSEPELIQTEETNASFLISNGSEMNSYDNFTLSDLSANMSQGSIGSCNSGDSNFTLSDL